MFKVTEEQILVEPLVDQVKRGEDGAVVTFVGLVRNNSNGKKVLYLEYDAYKEMAEKKLREIGNEIQAKWGLADVAICHRVGRMEVGETCVVIAVGAPHRKQAFEACHYAIDRLKQIVPIWKKEVYEDGEVWVEEAPHP